MKYKNNCHFLFSNIGHLINKLSPTKKKIFYILISVIVLIIFSLGIVGFFAYYSETESKLVNSVAGILSYPAAVVNGDVVKLSDYKIEYKAWKKVSDDQGSLATDSQIKEDVLNKMIYGVLVDQLAAKYDIEVTKEEIQAEVETIAQEFGDQQRLEEEVQNIFGWDMAEFEKRVVYQTVLNVKLQNELYDAEEVWDETRAEAKEVLEKIKEGEDFSQMAAQYSEDTGTKNQGGDLGWFGRGVMVKEFEDAAFALKPGQVSDLVKTQYGYHIILIEEKGEVETENEQGEKEIQEQVKARHILISPKTFSEYIQKLMAESKIWRFIKY